jgi:hypothetical protein
MPTRILTEHVKGKYRIRLNKVLTADKYFLKNKLGLKTEK